MDTLTRDALRAKVIEELMNTFPKGQKVAGGIAFLSETLDEDTGMFYPVEIKVSVKNTHATARSEAYDLDKAVADYAAKPGRRKADPEKRAAREAAAEATAAKKEANLAILRNFCATNTVDKMSASDIYNAIPELQASINVMNTGGLLKVLVEEGVLNLELDERRKKRYSNT